MRPSVPDRANSMNHIFCRQVVARGELGIAGSTAIKLPAFFQQSWSGSTMDCTINTTATQQRSIRCIDDGIHFQRRNVGFNSSDHREHDTVANASVLLYAIHIIATDTIIFRYQAMDIRFEAWEFLVELPGKLQIIHNSLVEALTRNQQWNTRWIRRQ